MGVRLALLACKGSHESVWFPLRGDERIVEVTGAGSTFDLELVCDGGEELAKLPLTEGENPFPEGAFRRYMVVKQLHDSNVRELATTVKVTSGD